MGYVFPTSLKSEDVGFGQVEGIVALALTSHPDFDDTPLWDENTDGTFDNDGIIWHPTLGGLKSRQTRQGWIFGQTIRQGKYFCHFAAN